MSTNPDPVAQLTAAVEKHAKLGLMAAQLPGRLAAAEEEVLAVYERLGIPLPGAKPGRARVAATPRPGTGRRPAAPVASPGPYVPEPGSGAEAVWRSLPGTLEQVKQATGLTSRGGAGSILANLERHGHVLRDETQEPPVYHRAGELTATPAPAEPAHGNGWPPADRERLTAALMETAGEEHG